MKKIYLLILILSSFYPGAYGRDESGPGAKESVFSDDGPFNASRAPYCGVCRKRHYGGCTPNQPSTPVPIDGGLSILLIAGAAYGAKRIRNKKQATQG